MSRRWSKLLVAVLGGMLLLVPAREAGSTASAGEGAGGRPAAGVVTYPAGTHTGLVRVDRVLDAFDSGRGVRLADLTRYITVRCTTKPGNPLDIQRPKCRRGEPNATPVEVFLASGCGGFYIRRGAAPGAFRKIFAGRALYAAFRIRDDVEHDAFAPRGGFGIVYGGTSDGYDFASTLVLNGAGKITALKYGCSETPAGAVDALAGELLLAPKDQP